jgi:type II restriction enzyme
MDIALPISLGATYKSSSQRARVITEAWAVGNIFCPACPADRLQQSPANTRAVDFECSRCGQRYQLKSKSSAMTDKIVDGAYEAMIAALNSDTSPNLYLLQYDTVAWVVSNLLLIPYFAFPPSAVEKRKPLSSTARRAGWVGCFIVLSRIPTDARIFVIRGGQPAPVDRVRDQYRRLLPMKQLDTKERGWTLDVLNLLRQFDKPEFTNADVYAQSHELRALHPNNRHVTDKIRQQLQVLRDAGFLTHAGRGRWRLI